MTHNATERKGIRQIRHDKRYEQHASYGKAYLVSRLVELRWNSSPTLLSVQVLNVLYIAPLGLNMRPQGFLFRRAGGTIARASSRVKTDSLHRA